MMFHNFSTAPKEKEKKKNAALASTERKQCCTMWSSQIKPSMFKGNKSIRKLKLINKKREMDIV